MHAIQYAFDRIYADTLFASQWYCAFCFILSLSHQFDGLTHFIFQEKKNKTKFCLSLCILTASAQCLFFLSSIRRVCVCFCRDCFTLNNTMCTWIRILPRFILISVNFECAFILSWIRTRFSFVFVRYVFVYWSDQTMRCATSQNPSRCW